MMDRKVFAAQTFIQANNSRAVRSALLARSRPLRRHYEVGEMCYYWRVEGDRKHQKCHWRGPAMACLIEPTVREGQLKEKVLWLVHGTSIIRCLHEQLRPEYPEERVAREHREP
eukprot:3515590-Pyramimonas_sp.AAC.1